MGLYLAFSAAARLGGSIELGDINETKPRGTRAVLRLPVAGDGHSGAGNPGIAQTAANQADANRNGPAPINTEKQA